uniref:Uncharacterized protein n=1 Tax=Candidatus Kentrum sp. MB TaxID=2138164 RepID=A0A450Y329_9GAMM|nr:MAG: hypothetical protein BECKMB1821G_GA0114241_11523 [Candidatus Kentron sp. MB]VFK35961.1 MAG: hypothetical protein BECKMB1821I_GA0114274_11692 [Candidatus Kentron sp. MB]VFK77604.1 MAG: hypothetical protein BECKMB1821H_GA0114242_11802 [Candidatus Kentron sp. MB]
MMADEAYASLILLLIPVYRDRRFQRKMTGIGLAVPFKTKPTMPATHTSAWRQDRNRVDTDFGLGFFHDFSEQVKIEILT